MFGDRLRQLRKSRGLTLEDLAEEIEVGRSTYAGYETEHRKPPLDNLILFAKYYNTSVDYILGLTDNPQSKEDESNFSSYLKGKNLTWEGVPLSDEELEPIRKLLEIVVRDRLPNKKNEK